jgi:tRNA 2-thiocytidine biosynthesis protein TtcA
MQRILSSLRRTIENYNMIEDGDKILVCLSGGKDSFTLLMALKALQRFYPIHFELMAASVNPGFEFFDCDFLMRKCEEIGVPLIIEESHIKEIVFDVRKEKNPCSLCANLRRGILNSIAIKESCNKIALGHNQDDSLETFLLNFLYAGNLSTFAPVSYMDRSKVTVIRPLIDTPEKDIKKFVRRANVEVMPKVCPMDGVSKREDMKNMILEWERKLPNIRANMIGAIKRANINGWK